jgi:hypothetical protein
MAWAEHERSSTRNLWEELIHIPSTRGKEGPAIRHMHHAIRPFVDRVALIPVDDSIIEEPDYAFPIPGISYKDTPNLDASSAARGAGQGSYLTPISMSSRP